MTEDHCNMEDYVLRGTGQQLILDVIGDGELEITDSRGSSACTYDDVGFDCESRTLEDNTPSTVYGLSATILLQTSSYGPLRAWRISSCRPTSSRTATATTAGWSSWRRLHSPARCACGSPLRLTRPTPGSSP